MRNTIRYIIGYILGPAKTFKERSISISKEEREFRPFLNYLSERYPDNSNSQSGILLVPLLNDVGTMKIISSIAFRLAWEKNLKIKYFYVHTAIDVKIDRSSKLDFYTQFYQNYNFFWIFKLCRIYVIKRRDILISNFFLPVYINSPKFKFRSKKQVVDFHYKGIGLGELIYDTYLRFRSRPTIELEDQCLFDIYDYATSLTVKWDRLLSSQKIEIILSPYTAYLHWGIPTRIALLRDVKVIKFGSFIYILSELRKEHPYHSKDHHLYRQLFDQLSSKPEKLSYANLVLTSRLKGNVDFGTGYMKSSAYHNSHSYEFKIDLDKPSAVIFLHCFFDSPHIYNHSLFTDFYEWILFILRVASQNSSINYYIKPHPNGLPANEEIIENLKKQYLDFENIKFISPGISNRQIMEEKPKAVFTLYGTIAHEFAYSGFPVITAGDNPHQDYNFLYNPNTQNELEKYLRNVGNYGVPEGYRVEEILEFFYMNYIHYSQKYNMENFTIGKNFEIGEINLPEDCTIEDILYYTK
jgi:hypothetical protein